MFLRTYLMNIYMIVAGIEEFPLGSILNTIGSLYISGNLTLLAVLIVWRLQKMELSLAALNIFCINFLNLCIIISSVESFKNYNFKDNTFFGTVGTIILVFISFMCLSMNFVGYPFTYNDVIRANHQGFVFILWLTFVFSELVFLMDKFNIYVQPSSFIRNCKRQQPQRDSKRSYRGFVVYVNSFGY